MRCQNRMQAIFFISDVRKENKWEQISQISVKMSEYAGYIESEIRHLECRNTYRQDGVSRCSDEEDYYGQKTKGDSKENKGIWREIIRSFSLESRNGLEQYVKNEINSCNGRQKKK